VEPREHHLAVTRTARYYTLGDSSPQVREVWFVLHGYAQLASSFLRRFEPCADAARLIVAPEALSRFYVELANWRETGRQRIGATWMTREDRLAEIDDYIGYLDTLHDRVFAQADRAAVRVLVLGFSQGVATACRWLCRGRARADTLVLWAGPLPTELDERAVAPLRHARTLRVLGDRDEYAGVDLQEAEAARLKELHLDLPLLRFDGGHELSPAVLGSLTA
jgi:predicted esterase